MSYDGYFERALIDLLHAKGVLNDSERNLIIDSMKLGADVRNTAHTIYQIIDKSKGAQQ